MQGSSCISKCSLSPLYLLSLASCSSNSIPRPGACGDKIKPFSHLIEFFINFKWNSPPVRIVSAIKRFGMLDANCIFADHSTGPA